MAQKRKEQDSSGKSQVFVSQEELDALLGRPAPLGGYSQTAGKTISVGGSPPKESISSTARITQEERKALYAAFKGGKTRGGAELQDFYAAVDLHMGKGNILWWKVVAHMEETPPKSIPMAIAETKSIMEKDVKGEAPELFETYLQLRQKSPEYKRALKNTAAKMSEKFGRI
jgi:hypothetical protein